nr:hypothetical protein HmN_001014300 [Hymenolepis microstoma]
MTLLDVCPIIVTNLVLVVRGAAVTRFGCQIVVGWQGCELEFPLHEHVAERRILESCRLVLPLDRFLWQGFAWREGAERVYSRLNRLPRKVVVDGVPP